MLKKEGKQKYYIFIKIREMIKIRESKIDKIYLISLNFIKTTHQIHLIQKL